LLLGLFFVYPPLLHYFLNTIGEAARPDGLSRSAEGLNLTMWGVLLFPTAAAAVTLTLLPAAWKGPRLVADNGTPWAWPWFPWSLFAFLSVAIVLRSFYLTISFHPHRGTLSGFGVYFLVPFLLSVCVLLFEIGKSINLVALQKWALVSPLALLALTLPGTDNSLAYTEFLDRYMQVAGAPILMTWGGLLLLYVYAWLRHAAWAESGVMALLLVGTILGPGTLDMRTLEPPTAPLLGALTGLFLSQACRFPRHSARWFAAVCTAIACAAIAFRGTAFTGYFGVFPAHLLLAAALTLGILFKDSFAGGLRRCAAAALLCLSFIALLATIRGQTAIPLDVLTSYLAVLTLIAWGAWALVRDTDFWLVAWGTTICLCGQCGLVASTVVRGLRNPRGVLLVASGGLSFLIAFGISLLKVRAGRLRDLREQLSTPNSENGPA
jgi:hypothetical protein